LTMDGFVAENDWHVCFLSSCHKAQYFSHLQFKPKKG
jgi:hypothetical protein